MEFDSVTGDPEIEAKQCTTLPGVAASGPVEENL